MIYAINKRTKEHVDVTDMHMPRGAQYVNGDEWHLVGADDDGWIKWEGGECPLPSNTRCDTRSGYSSIAIENRDPKTVDWRLVALYRPILDADEPAEPEAVEWDGEGLPPVGCECEAYDHDQGEWVQGRMLMHGNNDHAFASGSPEGWKKLFWAIKFRPIRSAEDKAVEEMHPIIAEWLSDGPVEIARTLYRSGYRKGSA